MGCRREGKYICNDCQKKLVVPEAICPMCCKPSLDGWTHPRCRTKDGIDRLLVGLPYRGVVQECLKKVKYKSAWEVLDFLWGIWRARVSSDLRSLHPGDVVTSVPMWRGKERARGFNQAEMISRLLAKSCKVTNLVMLTRTRETKAMFGLTRKERQKNIEGAFRLNPKSEILNPKLVVLVDDVWTTGATMRECARVLKRGGVGEVWGVALAR